MQDFYSNLGQTMAHTTLLKDKKAFSICVIRNFRLNYKASPSGDFRSS